MRSVGPGMLEVLSEVHAGKIPNERAAPRPGWVQSQLSLGGLESVIVRGEGGLPEKTRFNPHLTGKGVTDVITVFGHFTGPRASFYAGACTSCSLIESAYISVPPIHSDTFTSGSE